jgi:hypothetical protein
MGISDYLARKQEIGEAGLTPAIDRSRAHRSLSSGHRSDRSIFRYLVGQPIACFWHLNPSALHHRPVIAPINSASSAGSAALSAASSAHCLFERVS